MVKDKCWTPLQRQVRARWQRVVEQQVSSLLDIKEFCLAEKIPISTFYKWRQILRSYTEAEIHQLSPEFSAFMDSPPAFAEVNVAADEGVVAQDLAGDGVVIVEILLPNGITVRVALSDDVGGLAAVLSATAGLSGLADGRC